MEPYKYAPYVLGEQNIQDVVKVKQNPIKESFRVQFFSSLKISLN